jgi:hypothetical protein
VKRLWISVLSVEALISIMRREASPARSTAARTAITWGALIVEADEEMAKTIREEHEMKRQD